MNDENNVNIVLEVNGNILSTNINPTFIINLIRSEMDLPANATITLKEISYNPEA